jgi:hypothetical protein
MSHFDFLLSALALAQPQPHLGAKDASISAELLFSFVFLLSPTINLTHFGNLGSWNSGWKLISNQIEEILGRHIGVTPPLQIGLKQAQLNTVQARLRLTPAKPHLNWK